MNLILPNQTLRPVMVVSLDGTPFSLIQQRAEQTGSIWPRLLEHGTMRRIRSSRPEMSSVAWASYLTGANPGEHGVFGFVEPELSPRPRLIYPNGASLRVPTILQRVHDSGGTVVSINVPMTEPPAPLRGVTIGGFLGIDLPGNVHPTELEAELRRDGYVVDVEPALAYENRDRFLDALDAALDARLRAARRFALETPWDFFHLHIMETDRLFHFFWDEPAFADRFNALLAKCEAAAAEFAELAQQRGAAFVTLSDHGFTRARRIVFINALLEKAGLLAYAGDRPSFETIQPTSAACALAPGRVFLRLVPGPERDQLRDNLAATIREVRDPLTGEHPFASVDTREELYTGPYVDRAADLILLPTVGYDIKADFGAPRVFETPSVLVGTHTYDDAYFYSDQGSVVEWSDGEQNIADAGQEVMQLLGV
ncbi:alkaline phosphatase family protein [bacterium]|nr:alkaline phosphatase family protein [bacterium]